MYQATLPRDDGGPNGAEKPNGEEVGSPEALTQTKGSAGASQVENGGGGTSTAKSKAEKIQEGLERTISDDANKKIEDILNGVNQLSDVEKLLLYLKLPTGTNSGYNKDGSSANLASTSRLEQIQPVTWIKSHLEEDLETSLPKQEVFDDYRIYCESHGYKYLSQADFGKVMKCVFPNVKPRRLGQRGQSKHCYGGLRKKVNIRPPELPAVCLPQNNDQLQDSEVAQDGEEMLVSSCRLVCEWAERLLTQSFSNVHELAKYLVSNMYVNSRSAAAFTVLASVQKDAHVKSSSQSSRTLATTTAGSTINASSSSSRHRETQLQLQRKLQERELLREQKRKLEQQRSEIEADNDSRDSTDGGNSNVRGVHEQASETSQGKAVAIPATGSIGKSDKKALPSVTSQKLILPKTLSKAGPAHNCDKIPQGSNKNINGSPATAGAAQQILLFSPNPNLAHSNQLTSQPLLILSPLNQKNGAQQIQQATGAIQTTQQVNIIPPTKEHGIAKLQPVAMSIQQSSLSNGSCSNSSSASTCQQSRTLPTGMVISGGSQICGSHSLAGIQTSQVPQPLFRIVPSVSVVPSQTTVTASSHVTSTATSQGQVPVQVQHRPSDERTVSRTSTVCVSTLSSPVTSKNSTASLLTKENVHTITNEQFHNKRSLLFDNNVSDGDSIVVKKTGTGNSLTGENVSVVKKVNGTKILKINDPSQIPQHNNKDQLQQCGSANQKVGSPSTNIKSPLNAEKEKQLQLRARPISKTVSSLLKEQRGYGPLQLDSKPPYVNDRRPVCELLRESRKNQYNQFVTGSCLSPKNTCSTGIATPTISPSTVMIQTITLSKPTNTNTVHTSIAQTTPKLQTSLVTANGESRVSEIKEGRFNAASSLKNTHKLGHTVQLVSLPKKKKVPTATLS